MPPSKLTPLKYQTKTQALSAELLELAHQLGPDAKLPTMQELSKSMQVSMMTLNRALSELEAQGIIYRRQGSGTFVSPRSRQRTIGLVYDRDIFQSGASPFCGLLVDEARHRAASGDEKFSFYLAVPSAHNVPVHEDLVDDLNKHLLDGLLFVGEGNPEAARWLQRRDVPMVALAYTPIAQWRVRLNWEELVRQGVADLASKGCKKIGLWIPVGVGMGRSGNAKSFAELDSFRLALKEAKLPFDDKRVWQLSNLTDEVRADSGVTNQEQGYRAAFEVFGEARSRVDTDGLVILDDLMTRGAIVALEQIGLKVGHDIQIATHSNRGSDVLRGHESNVTTLEFDTTEIAQAMFSMLEILIEGGKPEEATVAVSPHTR